jgi:hypothetical protein
VTAIPSGCFRELHRPHRRRLRPLARNVRRRLPNLLATPTMPSPGCTSLLPPWLSNRGASPRGRPRLPGEEVQGRARGSRATPVYASVRPRAREQENEPRTDEFPEPRSSSPWPSCRPT